MRSDAICQAILTRDSPDIFMALPNDALLLFVKFNFPLISTSALSTLIHPPTLEAKKFFPRKLNGRLTVVIAAFNPKRNEVDR